MPAYIIAWVDATDPESMGQYVAAVAAVTESHGGRFLFAGPGARALEGDWDATAMAIIEFPSHEAAQRGVLRRVMPALRALRQAAGPTSLLITPDASPAG